MPGQDPARLADHRVARKKGTGAGRVLILGDMDTAFLPGGPERLPFRVEGDRALGPGIADMKGGLTVAVFAMKALEATGLNNLGEVACVLSADEQAGSLYARQVIEPVARTADWVFCMECAREGGNLMASRAQIGVARLEITGRDAHAGSAYGKGVNAIEAMARKITAIHALTDPGREIYLNVGIVKGAGAGAWCRAGAGPTSTSAPRTPPVGARWRPHSAASPRASSSPAPPPRSSSTRTDPACPGRSRPIA